VFGRKTELVRQVVAGKILAQAPVEDVRRAHQVQVLGEGIVRIERQSVRIAFREIELKGVVPGLAQRSIGRIDRRGVLRERKDRQADCLVAREGAVRQNDTLRSQLGTLCGVETSDLRGEQL